MSTPSSAPGGGSLLRFENVSLHFDEIVALDAVSFELHAGETRVVLGAAGSGKTTLLKAAIGLIRPDSGQIFLFGKEITHLQEAQLFEIRSGVGVLFQEGGLFDSITVEENVAYPLLNSPGHAESPQEVETKVREALRFVELEQTMEQYPSELSGGMRRRVGIARAVVSEPPASALRFAYCRTRSHYRQPHHGPDRQGARFQGDRQSHRHPALSGRATDGQLSIQSQQRTFGAGVQ